MELTKLQKVGIAYILMDLHHNDPTLKCGTIVFTIGFNNDLIHMNIIKDGKDIDDGIVIVLGKEENIDVTNRYEFNYTPVGKYFQIKTQSNVVGEC